MATFEKVTPVTEDEADDIRVTLELDEGEVECEILTIFEANNRDYIALMPLDKKGEGTGDVYLYRYAEDEEGLPQIDFIDNDEEYEIAVRDRTRNTLHCLQVLPCFICSRATASQKSALYFWMRLFPRWTRNEAKSVCIMQDSLVCSLWSACRMSVCSVIPT